jgi:hypothetical protein
MYSLVNAVGVEKGFNKRWKSVEIATVPVYLLFETYAELYITLSNPFLVGNVTIEISSLRAAHYLYQGTFTEFLTLIDSQVLTPSALPAPVIRPTYAKYYDAFRASYEVTPVNILISPTSPTPASDKTSLRLSRPNSNSSMQTFYKNCMVSVNGFFHQTDYDGTYAYALHANSSRLKSRQNQIGFLSFLEIGEIENVPVTPDMVYRQTPEASLRQRIYVKLNKNIENKTVILSLGGYLMFTDNQSFWQTGDDTFAIDINRIPFLERYFESQQYLDFTALGLPVSTANPDSVSVDQLLSDEILTKYLTLPQTFFVVIDTPRLFTNKYEIKDVGLPGRFITYSEPKYPLIVSNGRLAEYWKVYEDKQWSLVVNDSYLHNRVLSTLPINSLVVVSAADVPETPVFNSSGYLLEIGKDF